MVTCLGCGPGHGPQGLEVEIIKLCRERGGGLELVGGKMQEDIPASSWTFEGCPVYEQGTRKLHQSPGKVARKLAHCPDP